MVFGILVALAVVAVVAVVVVIVIVVANAAASCIVLFPFLVVCTGCCSTDNFLNQSSYSADPTEPVYICEFGTGTGKFAFLLLKKLCEYEKTLPFVRLPNGSRLISHKSPII